MRLIPTLKTNLSSKESGKEHYMEDWSYVPLDLDAARDVQHIWKSLADLHRREHGWTEQNIVDYFCRAITLDNRISNTSIIALVEVLRVKNLRVPPTP